MRSLSSLPLSSKMVIAFGFFFLVTVVLGAVAVLQLGAVNAGARGLQENWLPSTKILGDLNKRISLVRELEGAHILALSDQEADAAKQGLNMALADVRTAQATYERLPRSREEARLYQAFLDSWQSYLSALNEVLAVSRANPASASMMYQEGSAPAYTAASEQLAVLTDYNVAGGIDAARQSERAYKKGLTLIVVALLVQAALVVLARALFARSFVHPIVRLTGVMRALASEDTSIQPPYLQRGDEIGSMARSVEVFRQNAVELEKSRKQLAAQASVLENALAREREIVAVQRNFVAMASHEFRTPLTVIDGQAHRILKRRDVLTPEELAERIGKIRRAVARLTRVMDAFFRMARTPEGQIPFEPEECCLVDLLSDAISAQSSAEARRVESSFSDLPPLIEADAALLRQVFDNLLDNALKFSPDDTTVSVVGSSEPGWALVRVADKGIGLPEADLERLFERYFRASNAGAVPGTGVGLHIVRLLVDLHGGTVTARNRPGGGAEFTVRLPLSRPAPIKAKAA